MRLDDHFQQAHFRLAGVFVGGDGEGEAWGAGRIELEDGPVVAVFAGGAGSECGEGLEEGEQRSGELEGEAFGGLLKGGEQGGAEELEIRRREASWDGECTILFGEFEFVETGVGSGTCGAGIQMAGDVGEQSEVILFGQLRGNVAFQGAETGFAGRVAGGGLEGADELGQALLGFGVHDYQSEDV